MVFRFRSMVWPSSVILSPQAKNLVHHEQIELETRFFVPALKDSIFHDSVASHRGMTTQNATIAVAVTSTANVDAVYCI